MKTIREIIGDREAYSVDSTMTVQEVVEYLVRKSVGAVAVCEDDRVVGVFSERDLLRRVVHKGLDPTKENIANVMTKRLFHVSIDESHAVARTLMVGKNFRHLLVMDEEEHLRGFVSIRELLEVDLKESRELVGRLNDEYFDHQFKVPKK
jgi:CBS domain-containing protein